ncbi:MAG: DegT/DnrJ/EryC1/StrS aminotransferase family protein [Bacteroidetes bacterium]|nr:MAG: DegT/DnrJ/EryC1/StrS aminotransferase family protein [Bacteroidota bacterium]REJ99676.1 MAG: DegT/DnrJ/EryC1/StrS aminotransferase family protein [Bacteroidota bacterium]REK33909.1 MAG: DegT/DnrJ/EryC1/StrS aminotransferase family protein [Bacteroidota bacterium]REK47674.1 MAG: DegT/DnrJ/EryC1/StrS aminotransferase family protein [Bacteroidota bacterium]
MIPFSPPRIDQKIIDEVTAALKSGWITTGPRTRKLENQLSAFCGNPTTLCVNSATSGLELMLRWFGVGEGDEVIIPAYTYAATANVVIHCGAIPVLVDVRKDFNISIQQVESAITSRTKVIMPVDFGGWPCNYQELNALVRKKDIVSLFSAKSQAQKTLGRILILSDAAHSLGAKFNGKRTGSLTDVSVFSFHAVKNLTTAEGGAISLNLPEPFDNEAVYQELRVKSLHGQNKDALAKMQIGNWKYDVVEAGYKMNMTDIQAAIGLVELERYEEDTLPRRKSICIQYINLFRNHAWAILPTVHDLIDQKHEAESSCHLFPLRIHGVHEEQRDRIIQLISQKNVAVNVHFLPLPMLSFYRNSGYEISKYPITYSLYENEISLPVYYDLSDDQVRQVADTVISSVEEVLNS